MRKLFLLIVVSLIMLLLLQTPNISPAEPLKDEQSKVTAAIEKGCELLLTYVNKFPEPVYPSIYDEADFHVLKAFDLYADELILYALIKAGADPNREEFKKVLARVLEDSNKLRQTYRIACLAMMLEALDRQKYQSQITQCGQFLVDHQCINGQWGYGAFKKTIADYTPEPASSKGKPDETPELKPIKIKRRSKATEKEGSNSNTHYAILGLRACMEANVIIPKKTFQSARTWLTKNQTRDGGWNYSKSGKSYGSITAASIGTLAICDYYSKRNYKKNTSIRKAFKWLDKNFTVTANPKCTLRLASSTPGKGFHFYYLYALEKAGMLCGTETIGKHQWYEEGTAYLLSCQDPNGSWFPHGKQGYLSPPVETCFALLFLCRATKPLESK